MKPTQQFWIRQAMLPVVWIVANFIGGFLVGYLEDNGLQFVATIFCLGGIIGSLQWVVLRWIGIRDQWWPLASTLGWIFGGVLSASLSPSVNSIVLGLLHRFGMWEVFWLNLIKMPIWVSFMAIAQGSLLSGHTHFRGRTIGAWVLASWLGAAVNGAIGAWLCKAICDVLPKSLIGIVEGTAWASYSVVTGFALLWLLMQTPTTDENS